MISIARIDVSMNENFDADVGEFDLLFSSLLKHLPFKVEVLLKFQDLAG